MSAPRALVLGRASFVVILLRNLAEPLGPERGKVIGFPSGLLLLVGILVVCKQGLLVTRPLLGVLDIKRGRTKCQRYLFAAAGTALCSIDEDVGAVPIPRANAKIVAEGMGVFTFDRIGVFAFEPLDVSVRKAVFSDVLRASPGIPVSDFR
jgi:hypothetical protein